MYTTDCYGKLWGVPRRKRIYDWKLMGWITVTVIDIGRAFGIQEPSTRYDDPASSKNARPDVNTPKVIDWLRRHGPAYTSDIAEATGLDPSTVQGILRRGGDKFTCMMVPTPCGNGSVRRVRVWEVSE